MVGKSRREDTDRRQERESESESESNIPLGRGRDDFGHIIVIEAAGDERCT